LRICSAREFAAAPSTPLFSPFSFFRRINTGSSRLLSCPPLPRESASSSSSDCSGVPVPPPSGSDRKQSPQDSSDDTPTFLPQRVSGRHYHSSASIAGDPPLLRLECCPRFFSNCFKRDRLIMTNVFCFVRATMLTSLLPRASL